MDHNFAVVLAATFPAEKVTHSFVVVEKVLDYYCWAPDPRNFVVVWTVGMR